MLDSQGRVINKGLYPISRPDYSIFKEDSIYYRRKSKTGLVDLFSESFATVLINTLSYGRCIELCGLSSGLVDFTLNDTVTIPKGVTIKSNPGSVRIKLANGVNKDMFVVSDTTGDQYDYVWLDGLHLDGNRTNQTSGKGIVLKNITHSWITNCWIRDCRDYNIHAESTSGGNVYLNNWLLGTNGTNIYLEGTDDNVLNNWVGYGVNYGIFSDGNRHKILGNHIWEQSGPAIFLSSNLHTVSYNVIEKITGIGIEVNGHTNIVGPNQIVVEGGKAPTIGIKLDNTYSDYNQLIGNNIVGCTQQGILIGTGDQYNVVLGNILRSCPTGQELVDNGSNNEKAHNIIVGST